MNTTMSAVNGDTSKGTTYGSNVGIKGREGVYIVAVTRLVAVFESSEGTMIDRIDQHIYWIDQGSELRWVSVVLARVIPYIHDTTS